MKYDDASWHYGGDFPKDLPIEAGATHIAMFAVWAWSNGLAGSLIIEDIPEALDAVRSRATTPAELFLQFSDGKLIDEDLNDEANAFARSYYLDGTDSGRLGEYITDFEALSRDLPSSYHVPNTWETFDKFAPTISSRFEEWRRGQR
ncbi:MAG: hypothetical protein KF779_03265 [Hyphomonadaceae bacterium]|nr:hypothetical protein [Hyphomonadaceae bacterium]